MAVAIVAFNRPFYFLPTLRSILGNAEITECDLWIFLDGGLGSQQEVHCRIAEEEFERAVFSPRRIRIVRRPINFGCGRNLIDARRRLFDDEGYQWVYVFEDDLVVGPHYMALCRRMLAWSLANYPNVGVVQAYNQCWLSPSHKAQQLRYVSSGNPHWWGYLMHTATWNSIRGLLYEYESRFLMGRPYRQRDLKAIRRWVHEQIRNTPAGLLDSAQPDRSAQVPAWDFRSYFATDNSLGQDALTALGLALAGQQKLAPVVNRGLPIGRTGIHFTNESFQRRGLAAMRLDIFDADAHLSEFELTRSGPTDLEPYMRRDEQAVIVQWLNRHRPRRVLEFGAGGSSVAFSRVCDQTQWWSLEHDTSWIQRVLHAASGRADQRLTLLACGLDEIAWRLEELLTNVAFDGYLVDGYDRCLVLNRLHAHLGQQPGWVLLHDFARAEYQAAIERYEYQQRLTLPDGNHQGWLLLSR